jgi:hypothetical protein
LQIKSLTVLAYADDLLYTAFSLVLDLLKGYATPEVVAAIPQIQAIFTDRQ